ncbi:helix-hairpin-helix domain-containing protein [uncultured Paludibaculum sp.]|uniref:helix-hairpin-helix domain-containing protein n=1 Tax=uncultured Paludibaculum sp. TaxID=1765020 RepID=UPI002AAC38D7|nr:helix-hairpin-helix domain-containing protein [uncultured Paludibaculum sp.]
MADLRKLKDLDGIGPKMLKDFELLGIANIDQLKKHSGRKMYDRLCELTGQRQDPCVLDTFVCAVAQAKDPNLPAEQRNWWYWSRVRKGQIR